MTIAFDPKINLPGLERADGEKRAEDPAALKRLCQDFEALFIHSLFRQMRQSIPTDGFFERDMSMDFFEELMDMEVAGKMARQGGFGLARHLYEEFQRNKNGI